MDVKSSCIRIFMSVGLCMGVQEGPGGGGRGGGTILGEFDTIIWTLLAGGAWDPARLEWGDGGGKGEGEIGRAHGCCIREVEGEGKYALLKEGEARAL